MSLELELHEFIALQSENVKWKSRNKAKRNDNMKAKIINFFHWIEKVLCVSVYAAKGKIFSRDWMRGRHISTNKWMFCTPSKHQIIRIKRTKRKIETQKQMFTKTFSFFFYFISIFSAAFLLFSFQFQFFLRVFVCAKS